MSTAAALNNLVTDIGLHRGLPRHTVIKGMQLALSHGVPYESVLALVDMGKEWSAVEEHVSTLAEALSLIQPAPEGSLQLGAQSLHSQLAQHYRVPLSTVTGWAALGVPDWGIVYLLAAADMLGVSTEDDLYEAQRRGLGWEDIAQLLHPFATDMGWPMDGTMQRMGMQDSSLGMLSLPAMLMSSWDSAIDPGVLYGSDRNNPFQTYFASQNESINAASGALTISHTDLVLPGRGGLDFVLTRVFSSYAAKMYEPVFKGGWECTEGYQEWDDFYQEYYCPFGERIYVAGYDLPYVTTHLEDLHGLGVGWSFGFPSLEYVEDRQVTLLHLGDGRVYEIAYGDTPSNLKDHPLKDMVYRANTTYSSGQYKSQTALEMKDGTHYYFAHNHLIGIRDRYGNAINFTYDASWLLDEVTDTVGRTISFDYSDPWEIIVTVMDGTQALLSVVYELEEMEPYGIWHQEEYCEEYDDDYEECLSYSYYEYWEGAPRGWYEDYEEYIEGCESEDYYECIETGTVWVDAPPKTRLRSVTDPVQRVTTYDYTVVEAPFHDDWDPYGLHTMDNYYLVLNEVDYPTGGITAYEWDAANPVCTEDYCQFRVAMPRVTKRVDHANGTDFNEVTFTYNPLDNNKKEYSSVATKLTDAGHVYTETVFNDKHMMLKESTTWSDVTTQAMVTRTRVLEYFSDEKTPKTETVSYSTDPGNSFSTQMGYDEYRNLIYVRDDLGRDTFYVYDRDNYHLMLEGRTLLREAIDEPDNSQEALWQRTAYKLTPDKRNVGSETTYIGTRRYGDNLETLVGEHPGSMRSKDDWRWFVEGADEFNLSIYWYAGIFSGGTYEVYYRAPGDLDWTLGRRHAFSVLLFNKSGTDPVKIDLPYVGDWELRVYIPTLGSISTIDVQSVSAKRAPVVWDVDGDTLLTTFEYDSDYPSNLTRVVLGDTTNPEHWTNLIYDTARHAYVTQVEVGAGEETSPLRQKAEHDALGRVIKATQVQDNPGHQFDWLYSYDEIGRVRTVVEPAVIDSNGDLKQYTREWIYDDANQKLAAFVRNTGSMPPITSVSEIPGALGSDLYDIIVVDYDGLGRRLQEHRMVNGILQETHKLAYNQQGLVVTETVHGDTASPGMVTTYDYDALGRRVRTIYGSVEDPSPRNYLEIQHKDKINPNVTTTDSNGMVTIARFDAGGRLKEEERTLAGSTTVTTKYSYDLMDRVIRVEDPMEVKIDYKIGVHGRLLEVNRPGTHWEFTYDGRGNRISADYGNGVISFTYDPWDRVVEVEYPADGLRDEYTYTFFAEGTGNGLKVGAERFQTDDETPVNSVTTRYDPLGQLRLEEWSIHDNDSYTMRYDYDGAGRQTRVLYPDNQVVTYAYDQAGRLLKVEDIIQAGANPGFEYHFNGVLEKVHYANGAVTTFTPDSRYRPAQIETTLSGITLFNVEYTWDYEGNLTHIDQELQEYDGLYRLTTARIPTMSEIHTVSYTYDAAGNRRSETHGGTKLEFCYDASFRLESVRTECESGDPAEPLETFDYDAKTGAMISRSKDGIDTEYTYDMANRLTGVSVDGQAIAAYTYDAYGRLIQTVEHGTGPTRTTVRLPMGTETAYERITEGNDVLEQKYIRGNGMYLARIDSLNGSAPVTHYYHTDHLGSTRAVSQGLQDDAKFAYDAFGNVISPTGNINDHAYRFTGKPIDSTGLYYYGARFYDPTLGRFISQDPAMDGLNWYVYVNNNPFTYVDPDGQAAIQFIATVGTGLAFGAIEFYRQWQEVGEWSSIDVGRVGIEMAKGAVTGLAISTGIGTLVKIAQATTVTGYMAVQATSSIFGSAMGLADVVVYSSTRTMVSDHVPKELTLALTAFGVVDRTLSFLANDDVYVVLTNLSDWGGALYDLINVLGQYGEVSVDEEGNTILRME